MLIAWLLIFLVCALLVLAPAKNQKLNTTAYITIGLILILITATKDGELLWDYDAYINLFRNYHQLPIEPTFKWISKVIQHFEGNEFHFFLMYAILGVSTKLVAIFRSSHLIFASLLIYLSHFFVAQELIQIRAGVAAGLFLISIRPLYERNLKQYLVLNILGSLFHTSALLTLPLWFLRPNTLNIKIYTTLLLGSYLFAFIHIDSISLLVSHIPIARFQDQYEAYSAMTNIGGTNIFSVQQLLKICITLFLLIRSDKLIGYDPKIYLLIKIMTISLLIPVLLSENAVIAYRLRDVFGVIEILLFPLILYCFKPKLAAYGIFVVIALVLVIVSYLEMSPYHALTN